MARRIGSELTPDLIARFSPAALEHQARKAMILVTPGPDGWPHPAMLSHFEIVARDARNLRLATYQDSTTTRNLRETGRLTIVVVDEGLTYYVKGTAELVRTQMDTVPHASLINARIDHVFSDRADATREGDVAVTTGIMYDAPDLAARIANAGPVFAEMLA